MNTISIGYILGNEIDYFKLSYESVAKWADEIVIVLDSRSNDGTKELITELQEYDDRIKIFIRKWDTGTNQKHYLLKRCTMDYILFLDGDEVISDNGHVIKDIIKNNPNVEAFAIQGHHFIYNLGLEDNTVPAHYWYARLVKNSPELYMEGKNHAILRGYKDPVSVISEVRIFHLGYVKHLSKIMERYHENFEHGLQMHTPEFLNQWKDWHINGTYPVKKFEGEIPRSIKRFFKI